jgi:DNA-binding response OmpR family regulator
MNVLLIEDSAAFAGPIQQELAARGHDFTWIVGAQRLENGRIVGIRANPSADPMGDVWDGDTARFIDIDPTKFDIALCDGGLCGPVNDGVKFVVFLSALNIPCIAITGGGAGNRRLLDAGAIDGLPKEFVVLALRSGELNLRKIISTHASSLALQEFCSGLRQQFLQSRNTGNKLSLGYPILDGLDRCA